MTESAHSLLNMIESALRDAGAPVDDAQPFDNNLDDEAHEVGHWLEHNGLYLCWSIDQNSVQLSAQTYPPEGSFKGAEEEEYIKNGIIDSLSMAWLLEDGQHSGPEFAPPDNGDSFPEFKGYRFPDTMDPAGVNVVRDFWRRFVASAT